jgi:tetratricopeptide (TPR) repeat protein
MDCRSTLRLAALLLACVAGCDTLSPWQSDEKKKEKAAEAAKEAKASELIWTKQTELKPETLIAYAEFKKSAAEDPNALEIDKERCREQARTAYMRALKSDPKCREAQLGLARLFESTGNHERSVTAYHDALKIEPKNQDVWMELGLSHARCKEWEPALQSMKEAVKLDPDNKHNVETLGFTLARTGRYEEAFETLKQTIGSAEAHYRIAQMLHHMQQDDAARQHAEMALRENAKCKEAQTLLEAIDSQPAGAQSDAQVRQNSE